MSVKWYDPISERWHSMPKPKPVYVLDEMNLLADPGEQRNAANDHVWRAVVATATSSNMSEETACE